MAADLIAAVVAQLQNNSPCATAFGDSPSTPKFQSIQAFKAVLPYVRVLELPTSDMFQSAGQDGSPNYFEHGQLQVDVFATGESSARSLGKLVAAALNDAPLTFDDGKLLELRITSSFFAPEPDPGPGTAIVYHRVLTFLYAIQRSL